MDQVIYRVQLKHSCCNFYNFRWKWQAKRFLRQHPNAGWELKIVHLCRGPAII